MFFFIPVLCPMCLEKIFFFQTDHNYGVADNIEESINYHLCPFIAGKNYWNTHNIKICFNAQKQNEQNLKLIFPKLEPSFFFSKTKKIPKKAILLSYHSQDLYEKLYFTNFDFCSFSLLTTQKKIWRVGKIFDIELSKISKKKQPIAANLRQNMDKKEINLEKNNQKTFIIELKGTDLRLLERAENILLKKLHISSKPKPAVKKSKIFAIYPKKYKEGFARSIVFFLNEPLENFFSNLKFPQGISFSILEKNFSLKIKDIPLLDF